MESHLGVEVDCSIGGMNGADTALYALKMSQKYQRFVAARNWMRVCPSLNFSTKCSLFQLCVRCGGLEGDHVTTKPCTYILISISFEQLR